MSSKGMKANISSGTPAKRQRVWSTLSSSTGGESDPDDPPPASDDEQHTMPSVGDKLMAKMGYKAGAGLGKHEQGIKEPIAESKQRGRRGLGMKLPKVDNAAAKYEPSMEEVSAEEQVEWLDGAAELPPPFDELRPGITLVQRKEILDDEIEFCDPSVLERVLSTKNVLDSLEEKEKLRARSRANPFEAIRGAFFLNRAAMKMANMDAVFEFMFTEPKDAYGNQLLGPYELLYFADVCAGPGGFSEYVLWRKGWRAKGVGFTLKAQNDFKLDEFFAAPNDTFEPFYGVHGDGDVYRPDNIDSLYEHVMDMTAGAGVHFMMADGGFDVEGKENVQEVLSKRLYLCQCLVALRIVRVGGHLVVKLFDLFTPFSAGLVYLMHRCFAAVSIHKPSTSRPANSERYLICKEKRDGVEGVVEYLDLINRRLDELQNSDQDIRDIYPIEILTDCGSPFYEYLCASNNRLGRMQYVQLLKFVAYYDNQQLVETRQGSLRDECLRLWNIPDRSRQSRPLRQAADLATSLLGPSYVQDLKQVAELKGPVKSLQGRLKNAYDCYCCVIGGRPDEYANGSQPTLFLGVGGNHIYRYEKNGRWVPVAGAGEGFRLCRDTLVLGEVVKKFRGGSGNQTFVQALYIIDAAVLAGESVVAKPLNERIKLCETFARALYRRDNEIQAKEMVPLRELGTRILRKVSQNVHKNGRRCIGYPLDEYPWFLKPSGLLCLPQSNPPWIRAFSKTRNTDYWYNTITQKACFQEEKPKGVDADFKGTYNNMGVWWWDGVKFFPDQQVDDSALQFDLMLDFVNLK